MDWKTSGLIEVSSLSGLIKAIICQWIKLQELHIPNKCF